MTHTPHAPLLEPPDAVWYDAGSGERHRIGSGKVCARGTHESTAAFEQRMCELAAAWQATGLQVTLLHINVGHGLCVVSVSEPPTPAPLPYRSRGERGGRQKHT